MPRRTLTTTMLLLCALLLGAADAARPSPGYAAIVLKPGDFLVASGARLSVSDRNSGAVSAIVDYPSLFSSYEVATGPRGEVYVKNQQATEFARVPVIARVDPATGLLTTIVSLDAAGIAV